MAHVLRMPPESQLPDGPVRDFVQLLFKLYRDARRPPLRQISNEVNRSGEDAPTASTETIRRMLHGLTVPPRLETVEAVAEALCRLSGWDAVMSSLDAGFYYKGSDATLRSHLERAWHRALDEPDLVYDHAPF
jgi:hypothetical protein